MRYIAQPKVVTSALLAAVATALACYPRLVVWETRRLPVWYLELVLLLGTFFLWSFVLGWQRPYGGRDPLQPSKSPALWALATGGALAVAALHYWLFDPVMRGAAPDEFPSSPSAWLAMTLSSVTFTQLFVVFAPLAFFLRMISRRKLALALTLAFNLFVMLLKASLTTKPLTPALLSGLILIRLLGASFLVFIYLEGGLPLACWVSFVVQTRYLLELPE
jgi:hypothetical protein